ncbi:hypothetical protein NHN26_00365 [Rhodovulum tesquicola]|uniref:DUF6538 domain-containing protein n=1 Tax=Rhodovulum tesquicola TaxID=540254 RepID=UPI002097E1DC|nr:DUF6538 domain-containing protein [Rhodovulum tesquicola]MCO8143663.1 hypothetical protein [Rhodovulum tesquicola]
MGLVLKYVERTKAGSWQYRRRVPKQVAEVITKREFKKKLGDSKKEALAAYPRFHAEVEREIAKALHQVEHGEAADRGKATEREAYQVALARAAELAPDGTAWITREAIIERIASRYRQDPETLDPIGATDVDRLTINLVRNGERATARPEPTLEDAKRFYIKERMGGDEGDTGVAHPPRLTPAPDPCARQRRKTPRDDPER